MSTLKANKFQHISATGTNTNIEFDSSRNVTCKNDLTVDGSLLTADTVKIKLGTGNDLQLWHSNWNSFVQHTGTSIGNLYIDSIDADVVLRSGDGSGSVHTAVNCKENGAVELYYDNAKKFETNGSGAQLSAAGLNKFLIGSTDASGARLILDGDSNGDGSGTDYCYIEHGTDGDLSIHCDNPSNDAQFELYVKDGTELAIVAAADGAVSLYYDHAAKLLTTSYGTKTEGRGYIDCNDAGEWAFHVNHDGNDQNRYGLLIYCGTDDASGTNYAMFISDGDGSTQGQVTFTSGTVSYGAFTAHHPCVVPTSDNPSDNSMAYPYGTLLETVSIAYSQKNGANTERGIRYNVQKTQTANSKKVLGAYGGSMNGGPDNNTNLHEAAVLGDGHILCNNSGGNISVGDGICSSSTAGIGQKATASPSMIIGIAQEDVTFTGTETKLVPVQYGLQQFTPWGS